MRVDGRKKYQLRPISIDQGLLNQADGSARLTIGDTIVTAAVFGPGRPTSAQKEDLRGAVVEVTCKTFKGIAGPEEKEQEVILRESLMSIIHVQELPRTMIHIIVEVIHDDGSALAAAVNAATMALMDAGIPMRATASAVSCAIMEDETVMIDPSHEEEEASKALLCFAFDVSQAGILASYCTGLFEEAQFFACAEIARRASDSVQGLMRIAMEQKLTKFQLLEEQS